VLFKHNFLRTRWENQSGETICRERFFNFYVVARLSVRLQPTEKIKYDKTIHLNGTLYKYRLFENDSDRIEWVKCLLEPLTWKLDWMNHLLIGFELTYRLKNPTHSMHSPISTSSLNCRPMIETGGYNRIASFTTRSRYFILARSSKHGALYESPNISFCSSASFSWKNAKSIRSIGQINIARWRDQSPNIHIYIPSYNNSWHGLALNSYLDIIV